MEPHGEITSGRMLRTVRIYNHSMLIIIIYLEHFIVWMRTAGLPNFRKLYGRVETAMAPGTYTMQIWNYYDVSSFDGKKSFVLSTTNALGGKNYFLAICYIVVGSLCILFAVIFCIAYLKKKGPKRQAD